MVQINDRVRRGGDYRVYRISEIDRRAGQAHIHEVDTGEGTAWVPLAELTITTDQHSPAFALTPAQIAAERESWATPLANATLDTWQNGAARCSALVAVGDGGNSWGTVLRYTLFDGTGRPCKAAARTLPTAADAWATALSFWRADVARRLEGAAT